MDMLLRGIGCVLQLSAGVGMATEWHRLFSQGVIWHGPSDRRCITLSFDDGPDPRTTPHLLNVLAEWNCPATFFVLGVKALAHPGLTRELVSRGHELAPHGHTHRLLAAKGRTTIIDEVRRSSDVIETASEQPVRFFRPPYGVCSPTLLRVLENEKMKAALWSVTSFDCCGTLVRNNTRLETSCRAGDIVCFHERVNGGFPALSILRDLLPGLLGRRFCFKTLGQLLETGRDGST